MNDTKIGERYRSVGEYSCDWCKVNLLHRAVELLKMVLISAVCLSEGHRSLLVSKNGCSYFIFSRTTVTSRGSHAMVTEHNKCRFVIHFLNKLSDISL